VDQEDGARPRRAEAPAVGGSSVPRRDVEATAGRGRAHGAARGRGLTMSLLALLVLACSLVASIYQLVQMGAARRFLRRAPRPAGDHRPPVTVLKPLKGPGFELAANLETFCRQDYPDYQIVFGVEDPSDPAADVVRSLQRRFPERDIALSVGLESGS